MQGDIPGLGQGRPAVLLRMGKGEKMLLGGLLSMFLMGVLQAFAIGSEFIESCGYPVNASYIVFFMLAQINIMVIVVRTSAKDLIMEDLWNVPPIRFMFLLLFGLPGFQFPPNVLASMNLSAKCQGLEIPLAVQFSKYIACVLSGIIMLALLVFGLAQLFTPTMEDQDWWVEKPKKKLPDHVLQSLWTSRGTTDGCNILCSQAIGEYIPIEDFLEDEICQYYIREIMSKQITYKHEHWLKVNCRICNSRYVVNDEVILLPKKVTKDNFFKHLHTDCLLRLCTSRLTEISSPMTFLSNLHESINFSLPLNPPELIIPSQACPYKSAN